MEREARRARRDIVPAGPLLAAFAAVAAVAVWQALNRHSPTIFSDELEITQISRAIASDGHPERRDVSYGFTTLVPWLTAPFWWIGSVEAAFDAIKVFQALVMTAAIFPAYGLARFVVSRPWAIAAAVLSVTVPALAYAPILKEEPFAYTASTTALFLVARGVAAPSRTSLAIAFGAAAVAALVRTQLVVLVGVAVLAAAARGWRGEAMRRRRAAWSRRQWSAAALAIGLAAVLAYVVAAAASSEVDRATTELRGRTWEYGVWAVGAWAIGVGIAPAIALLAALVRPRPAYRSQRVAAFTTVTALAVAALVVYAAVKAAAISEVLGPLIVERNLIYLTPLAMASLVSLVVHRDSSWWAIAAATGATLYVVSRTPLEIRNPYYEAHGTAIMAYASSRLGWTPDTIDWVRSAIAVGAGVVLLVLSLRAVRGTRVALAGACGLLVATAVWGSVAEIHADRGERAFADGFRDRTPRPATWIDEAAGGAAVTVLGQQMGPDPTDIWLAEFWNRGIRHVWSVDGTAPGPGPTLTPDLAATDGTLTANAGTAYALALPGIDLAGEQVAEMRRARLVRLGGGVLRLRSSQTGIGEGSWTGPRAAFNHFSTGHRATTAALTLSRSAFCAQVPVPSEVDVRIGPLTIGRDHQPAIARVTREERVRVTPCSTVPLELPVPAGPWRIEIRSDVFVPREVDPSLGDVRQLGVQATLTVGPA